MKQEQLGRQRASDAALDEEVRDLSERIASYREVERSPTTLAPTAGLIQLGKKTQQGDVVRIPEATT
jgi:hypothetical protein